MFSICSQFGIKNKKVIGCNVRVRISYVMRGILCVTIIIVGKGMGFVTLGEGGVTKSTTLPT